MKRGDVFKVGDGEQLYYADAIAPNGSVYALPYDPETGRGRKLTIFKADVKFQVLFNNRKTPPKPPKPEPLKFEEGWDYCEMTARAGEDYNLYWCAHTIGTDTTALIGKSGRILYDPRYEKTDEQAYKVQRQTLMTQFIEQGWQVIEDKEHKVVLKRKQSA